MPPFRDTREQQYFEKKFKMILSAGVVIVASSGNSGVCLCLLSNYLGA